MNKDKLAIITDQDILVKENKKNDKNIYIYIYIYKGQYGQDMDMWIKTNQPKKHLIFKLHNMAIVYYFVGKKKTFCGKKKTWTLDT